MNVIDAAVPRGQAAGLCAPADSAGRRHRRRDSASLSVTHIRTVAAAVALAEEWQALYSVAAQGNPFSAPDWVIAWARHFVPERDLDIFAPR